MYRLLYPHYCVRVLLPYFDSHEFKCFGQKSLIDYKFYQIQSIKNILKCIEPKKRQTHIAVGIMYGHLIILSGVQYYRKYK